MTCCTAFQLCLISRLCWIQSRWNKICQRHTICYS